MTSAHLLIFLSQYMFLYQLPAKYSASFDVPEQGTCVLEQKLREAKRARCPGNTDHTVIWKSSGLKMLQERHDTVLF